MSLPMIEQSYWLYLFSLLPNNQSPKFDAVIGMLKSTMYNQIGT